MNNTLPDKNRRVLVIDDNRSIHDDFRKILSPAPATTTALDAAETALFGRSPDAIRQTQFEVDSAYQGQEGLLLVQKALEAELPYALAIVDVRMPPGWDGVETTRKILELDPNLQIVLCTAYSDYSWGEMFEKLGHRDGLLILKKPFDTVEAFLLVRALTEKWWLHQQSRGKMEELESRVAERTRELRQANHAYQTEVVEHKCVEKALRANEALLKNAQRIAHLGHWERDFVTQRLSWSDEVHQIFGVPPERFNGTYQAFLDCVHPDDRARLRRCQDDIIAGGGALDLEHRIVRPDGTIRWVREQAEVGFDATGKPARLFGTVLDITAQRSAEQGLRESEERFRVTFEQAAVGIAHVAPDGHFLRVNDKLCDISGYSRNELLRLRFTELSLPEELANGEEARRSMVAGERHSFSIERRYRRKSGDVFWAGLVTTLLRESTGEPKYFISVIEDITPRKRAEEALQESEERFSGAFEHAPIGKALVSPDGRWLKVNRALCALVGYSEAELLTRTFQDITHPEDLEVDLENVRRTIAGEIGSYQVEKRYVHRRGHLVSVLLNVSLVRDVQGLPRYFISQIQDITERKRYEAALTESELRYHSLFENMLEGYAYCQTLFEQDHLRDFIYLEVNSAFENLTGLKNVVGRKVSEVIPGIQESNRELFAIYGRVALTGKPEKCETYVEGLGIWLCITVYSSERAQFVAVFENITMRKQAEEALRTSEVEFRTLAEAMPQIVWITRPDGWNTYFSQQWMDYTGLTLEESVGDGWNEPFHPEDQQRARDAWQHATATIGVYSLECRLRRADGAYRWWLIRGVPQPDATGNILKWFGTCTDIHDLKLAELEISRTNQALRQAEAKYRSIFENSNEGIFQSTPDGRYISANPALARMLGFASPEELIRERTDIGSQGYVDSALRAMFKRTLEERGFINGFEYEAPRRDGTKIWISENSRIVRDAAGNTAYYEGSLQDITARKRSEADLEKTHKELLEASRRAGMAEVATSVLHNVGNVLNSVNVSSSCLADSLRRSKAANLSKVVTILREHEGDLGAFLTRDPKGKQLPDYLAQLAEHLTGEQADALEELAGLQKNIEHIKDIVAMQQSFGQISGVTETLQVTDLVDEALKMNSPGLLRGDIQVIKEFEQVPPIMVEKHKVLQILVNLVRNAKQACDNPDRGEKRLTFRVTNGNDRVRIAVSDNGVGIPSENLTRIFRHGFTTKKGGHGFGLHSGALAAKEMGGSLSVQSEGAGHGATFTLELPLLSPKVAYG